jgi:hypothetical protein
LDVHPTALLAVFSSMVTLLPWIRNNGLLAKTMACPGCLERDGTEYNMKLTHTTAKDTRDMEY